MINIELETGLIGNLLVGGDAVDECLKLKEDDFTVGLYQRILRASRELQMESEEVSVVTVFQKVKDITTVSKLADLTLTGILDLEVKSAVKELRGLSLKRNLNRMAREIMSSKEDGDILADKVEREVYQLREETSVNEFAACSELTMQVFKDIEDMKAGRTPMGLSTGYKALDQILGGGLKPGKMIVIGARPGMGKTALALNIAERVTRDPEKSVAIFSLEMEKKDIMNRIITSYSKVNTVGPKPLTDDEWLRLTEATGMISNRNIHINDNPATTVPEMLSMGRKLKRQGGLDLVVIDYLQFINSNEDGKRMEQLDIISRQIKAMSKSLDVPVILIASLNRGVEARNDKRPMLSDLRETGQIEYDADTVLMLYRDEYYNEDTETPGMAEVLVVKNRGGQTGTAPLTWFGKYMSFENMEIQKGDN